MGGLQPCYREVLYRLRPLSLYRLRHPPTVELTKRVHVMSVCMRGISTSSIRLFWTLLRRKAIRPMWSEIFWFDIIPIFGCAGQPWYSCQSTWLSREDDGDEESSYVWLWHHGVDLMWPHSQLPGGWWPHKKHAGTDCSITARGRHTLDELTVMKPTTKC